MGKNEMDPRAASLAREVLEISRNTILIHFRFFDMALAELSLCPFPFGTISTDGRMFAYNPLYVLKRYAQERNVPTRDTLHVMLHCLYRHYYVDGIRNEAVWDLACDIAVEVVIDGMRSDVLHAERSTQGARTVAELQKNLDVLTAEKIYRYYLDLCITDEMASHIRKNFMADDHSPWYSKEDLASEGGGDAGESPQNDEEGNAPHQMESEGAREAQRDRWKEISERMQQDLETFSKAQGDMAGAMMQNLREVNRERYDYAAFLKKFAVMNEAMRINDDEFDYVFYTYGLKLFKNLPLIEPLEYKDVKQIREFVIVIDTSGSVQGELVQTFINKTYNILKSTESFASRINLHIIQCDAEVQEAVKITSQEEFDRYLKNMTVKGLGGTDFRPAFEYVDELLRRGEFHRLKGVIYFTDGWGTFPQKKPPYDVAFVFIKEDAYNPDVPSWAIKLDLSAEDVEK